MTRVATRTLSALAVVTCLAVLISSQWILTSELRVTSAGPNVPSLGGDSSPPDPLTLVPPLTTTLTSPVASSEGEFGHSVAFSGNTVAVGAPYETASGHGSAGHAYVINATTGVLISTLTSPKAQPSGYFGSSVAVSGDLVVVGAPTETAGGHKQAGHAYIFDWATGDLVDTLTSPNAQVGGYFGASVAIDATTVVVGAIYESASGQSGAGHAYVFDATTGALISKLKSPNVQTGGFFGASVAINGSRLAVGAPYETASGSGGAGHAYDFKTTGGLVSSFTSPNAQSGGGFGSSVAISAKQVVVGAPNELASGYSGAGNTYIFKPSGTLISTVSSPNAQSSGEFGSSVAIDGATIVVGAPSETAAGQEYAGHAYVVEGGNVISILTSPSAQVDGYFGNSVSTNGVAVAVGAPYETASGFAEAGHTYLLPAVRDPLEYGDSVAISGPLVVVGAPDATVDGYADAGNAYVFSATTGALFSTLNNPGPQTGAEYGASVAISGDTVVVGTLYYTVSGHQYAGRAYVFDATTGVLTETLNSPKVQSLGHFGWSVAVSGTTAVIGAPYEKASGVATAGNAYSFDTATGDLISKLTNPSPVGYGEFGYSVSVSGTTAVVGAAGQNLAYVYDSATGGRISTLTSPCTCGQFGTSVAISGSTVIVGAPSATASSGPSDAGLAYVFDSSGGAPTSTLTSGNPQSDGEFGNSVAISGADVLVGAPGETSSTYAGAGNAYVFSSAGGAPTSTLTSPNAQTGGGFGWSLAIDSLAEVVGAPFEQGTVGIGAGNAYVF